MYKHPLWLEVLKVWRVVSLSSSKLDKNEESKLTALGPKRGKLTRKVL